MKIQPLDKLEAPEVVDFKQLDLESAFDDMITGKDDEKPDNLDLNLDKDKNLGSTDDQPEDDKDPKGADENDESTDDSDPKPNEEGADDVPDTEEEGAGDDEEVQTLVNELTTRLGLETDTEFEDSLDGLVDLAREASEQLAQVNLNSLFDELPDVKEFMQFRLQGGTAESFFETMYPTEDYATLKVAEDDTALQERLVRRALSARGMDEEDMDSTLDEFKTSGILKSQADKALKGLVKFQASEKETLIKEQKAVADQETQNQEAYLKEVKDLITKSTDFKGVMVSEKDKESFFHYVSDTSKHGQSQFTLDMQEAPTETYLAIAALMRKGFNFAGLISRKAASQRASNLKERLKKEAAGKLRSQEDRKKGHVDSVPVEDLDLGL